ncbi:MAG: hypothetical protein H6700_12930 [Myxococcales bacterium]|nr:hypothetical protein [Myxococcales bacterium]
MSSRHCPRCGATLPLEDEELLCPGCGAALGAKTEAIEVSADELLAELERRRSGSRVAIDEEGELEGEVSVVTTTPSGLLKSQAMPRLQERRAKVDARHFTPWLPIAVAAALALVVLLVWLTWDALP